MLEWIITIAILTITTLLLTFRRLLRRITQRRSQQNQILRVSNDTKRIRNGTNEQELTISGLYIYPVKSLRATSLSKIRITPSGLDNDRRLMIVRKRPPPSFGKTRPSTEPTHRFVTQRQCPSLATITASLSDNELTLSSDLMKENDSVTIDISPQHHHKRKENEMIKVGIWDDTIDVMDIGGRMASSYIRSIMQIDADYTLSSNEEHDDIRLVGIIPNITKRKADHRYVPPAAWIHWNCDMPDAGFTDGFPILVTNESSLEELNRRRRQQQQQEEDGGGEDIPMSRFRPNIVIKGAQPFEEDTWKAIRISNNNSDKNVILHLVKGCPRCKQSCTDQLSGERFDEPLKTLSTFRALNENSEDDVYFGQNAVVQGNGNIVNVGDVVTVLTTGEPVWDQGTVAAE